MVVHDVKGPPPDQVIGAIKEQVLASSVVARAELARPAFGGDRDRLERPPGTLLPNHAHLVPPSLEPPGKVVRHQLDASVAAWGYRKPGRHDHRDAPAVHIFRTPGSGLSP